LVNLLFSFDMNKLKQKNDEKVIKKRKFSGVEHVLF